MEHIQKLLGERLEQMLEGHYHDEYPDYFSATYI